MGERDKQNRAGGCLCRRHAVRRRPGLVGCLATGAAFQYAENYRLLARRLGYWYCGLPSTAFSFEASWSMQSTGGKAGQEDEKWWRHGPAVLTGPRDLASTNHPGSGPATPPTSRSPHAILAEPSPLRTPAIDSLAARLSQPEWALGLSATQISTSADLQSVMQGTRLQLTHSSDPIALRQQHYAVSSLPPGQGRKQFSSSSRNLTRPGHPKCTFPEQLVRKENGTATRRTYCCCRQGCSRLASEI